MRIRKAFAAGLLALTPALTGCLVHTHSVIKTRLPPVVYSATIDQLLKQVDERNANIQTMTAFVDVVACTGGASKGEVKCYPSFSGFIIIAAPQNVRFLLNVPLVGGRAFDMVSDGKTFKLWIPRESCVITGSDEVTNTAQKGLYALRPAVILDSLMIRGLQANQVVSMTQDSWTPPQPKSRKGIVEDPDYDIEFLSEPQGQNARTLRVVHVDRVNLLPWRQDIYNDEGKVATQAFYSNYRKFGDVNFPSTVVIQRPLDELTLTITVNKRTNFNQKMPDNEFTLDIPEATAHITNMDDPASATLTTPCAAHAPQSTH